MTLFVIYLLISGIGFPVTLTLLIKSKRKEREECNSQQNL